MDEYSEIDYLRKAKKSDEKVFVKIFENYSYFLGLSLKNIINLFSPDYILIGGEAMEFKEYFLEKSIEIAKKNSFGRLSLKIVFDQDKLGEDSWVLGGIYRVIESNLF
jgi:predicted NBD/HSP70 family sugar kinase